LKALQVPGTRIDLKINVRKTKSPRPGITKEERKDSWLPNTDHMDGFIYLGSVSIKILDTIKA
jgi:hypothetical protein